MRTSQYAHPTTAGTPCRPLAPAMPPGCKRCSLAWPPAPPACAAARRKRRSTPPSPHRREAVDGLAPRLQRLHLRRKPHAAVVGAAPVEGADADGVARRAKLPRPLIPDHTSKDAVQGVPQLVGVAVPAWMQVGVGACVCGIGGQRSKRSEGGSGPVRAAPNLTARGSSSSTAPIPHSRRPHVPKPTHFWYR